jgi:hypothetical protein
MKKKMRLAYLANHSVYKLSTNAYNGNQSKFEFWPSTISYAFPRRPFSIMHTRDIGNYTLMI